MEKTSFVPVKNRFSRILILDPTIHYEEQLKFFDDILVSCKGNVSHDDDDDVIVDIIRLTCCKDIRLKKMIYLYLSMINFGDSDMLRHLTNSALHDAGDPNPMIRTSTLRSLTELKFASDLEELFPRTILNGLKDPSPTVRCVAVDGVVRFCRYSGEYCHLSKDEFSSLFEEVAGMISNDPDPSVVVRAVECLAMCKYRDETVQNSVLSLLDRITLLDKSLTVTVLNRALISVNKDKLTEGKTFELLNKLDPLKALCTDYLIAIESIALMHSITTHLAEVRRDILLQVVASFLSLYSVSNQDVKYLILCSLLSIVDAEKSIVFDRLRQNINFFLLLASDSPPLMMQKLKILRHCLAQSTAELVYMNIRPYFHRDVRKDVAKYALETLVYLNEFIPKKCSNTLCMLLSSNSSTVVNAAVVSLSRIQIKHMVGEVDFSVPKGLPSALVACYKNIKGSDSKSSFWSLICDLAESSHISELSNILREEIESCFSTITGSDYQHCVLTTVIRLFLKYQSKFYIILKSTMSKILQSMDDSSLKDQARTYYKLLKEDISLLRLLIEPVNKVSLSLKPTNATRNNAFNSMLSASVALR